MNIPALHDIDAWLARVRPAASAHFPFAVELVDALEKLRETRLALEAATEQARTAEQRLADIGKDGA